MLMFNGDKEVFTFHPLGGFRGVCREHKICVCWFSVVAASKLLKNPLLDLVNWGAESAATTEDAHWHEGQLLKTEYGMKVKV